MTTQIQQNNEYFFGYESGSMGYNTLRYLILEPVNDQVIKYTIIMNDNNQETVLPSMTSQKPIIIDQNHIEPYPTMSINISGKNIHSKKYYYEKVKVIIEGDCKVSSQIRIDVDR